jgi:hypothetical protein
MRTPVFLMGASLVITALAGAGFGGTPAKANGSPGVRELCPVTRPNGDVPPGAPTTFFGNGRLATDAYGVIEADARTLNADGSVTEKFPWWGAAGLPGKLRITGKRRRPTARHLRASIHAGGVEDAPPGTHFWASEITFPKPGCWTIRGRVGQVRLSLVVLVKKPSEHG